MQRGSWTPEQLKILREEYPGIIDPRRLVDRLGKTYHAIKSKALVLGLHRELHAGSIWTRSMEKKLSRLYPNTTNAKIGEQLGLTESQISAKAFQFGLRKTNAFMRKHSKKGFFKKGHAPANKGKKQSEYMSKDAIARTAGTRFTKGHLPHNAVGFKDGDISLRCDHKKRGGKSYKYIRLSQGKWYPLHQHQWEQQNGKLPKGYCLWFKDGDTMNCELTNLELITRAENMRRNSCSVRLTDNYVAATLSRKKGHPGITDKRLLKVIKDNKELIDLKRAELLLKRTIKSKSDVKKG